MVGRAAGFDPITVGASALKNSTISLRRSFLRKTTFSRRLRREAGKNVSTYPSQFG